MVSAGHNRVADLFIINVFLIIAIAHKRVN